MTIPPSLDRSVTVSLLSGARTNQADRVTFPLSELLHSLTTDYRVGPKEGGAWSPILWRDDTRDSAGAESVCALVYDLDDATPEMLESLGLRLDATRWIHAIHETHTAGRYRLILPLSRDLTPSEYERAWQGCADRLVLPGLDETGKDLARLFYLPSKPTADDERLAGTGGEVLLDPAIVLGWYDSPNLATQGKTPSRTETSSQKFSDRQNGTDRPPDDAPPSGNGPVDIGAARDAIKASGLATEVKKALYEALDMRLVLRKGERENQLHRLTCSLVAALPGEDTTDAGKASAETLVEAVFVPLVERMERDSNETADYFLSRVGSSFDRAWEHRVERLEKLKARREIAEKFFRPEVGADGKESPDAWRSRLLLNQTKEGPKCRPCTANLDLILEHDEHFKGRIHFNELKRLLHFDDGRIIKGSPKPSNLSTAGLELSNWLQTSEYGIDMSDEKCGRALLLAARRHSHNPVAEYLEGLVWDGVPRIADVMVKWCNAEGNAAYIRDITRKFFISAAARGLEPGCKVDTVPVLQGKQGTRKTSFVETLAGEWYTTVSGKTDDKDTKMQATSAWFVELSELASMGKSSVESLRGFLTQRLDHIRLPYAAAHEEFLRRCVFVGTTNSEQPLIDQEGNRRFWVVTCGEINLREIAANRDQLWAEAVWCFREFKKEEAALARGDLDERGEPLTERGMKYRWWLTPDEQVISDEENSVYQSENPIDSEVRHWLVTQEKPIQELPPMTVTEVAKKILSFTNETLARDVGLIVRIGKTLKSMGWEKVRCGPRSARYWAWRPVKPRD